MPAQLTLANEHQQMLFPLAQGFVPLLPPEGMEALAALLLKVVVSASTQVGMDPALVGRARKALEALEPDGEAPRLVLVGPSGMPRG